MIRNNLSLGFPRELNTETLKITRASASGNLVNFRCRPNVEVSPTGVVVLCTGNCWILLSNIADLWRQKACQEHDSPVAVLSHNCMNSNWEDLVYLQYVIYLIYYIFELRVKYCSIHINIQGSLLYQFNDRLCRIVSVSTISKTGTLS